MFLKELNKKEGNAFINLVKYLAMVDDQFASEEENLLKEYEDELGLCPKCIETLTQEETLNELKESSERVRNIVYFEILGLALVDGKFDEKEVEFIDKVATSLDIKEDKVKSFLQFFREVQFMYEVTYTNHEDRIKEIEGMAKSLI